MVKESTLGQDSLNEAVLHLACGLGFPLNVC